MTSRDLPVQMSLFDLPPETVAPTKTPCLVQQRERLSDRFKRRAEAMDAAIEQRRKPLKLPPDDAPSRQFAWIAAAPSPESERNFLRNLRADAEMRSERYPESRKGKRHV